MTHTTRDKDNAPPADDPRTVDAVLRFWFEELTPQQWFGGGRAVDARIRARFATLHAAWSADLPAFVRRDGPGHLAAVIVLDQFSRNLHRDDPRAFANDAAALGLARDAVTRGVDAQLTPRQRGFLYMPFLHAEDAAAQAQGVALFAAAGLDDQLKYAQHHRDVIERFGRFPHRNGVLGRESTAEEHAWLRHPDPLAGAAPTS